MITTPTQVGSVLQNINPVFQGANLILSSDDVDDDISYTIKEINAG